MKPLRIAALGLWHESNTFVRGATAFESFTVERGDDVRTVHAAGSSSMAGFLAAEDASTKIDPLLFAHATPAGPVSVDVVERLWSEMEAKLAASTWDAVLLAQHGAAVGQAQPDLDAELVSRVRATVGDDVTIGVALDLHANISQRLIDAVDVCTLYRTNPHLDAAIRALRCAEIVKAAARGTVTPVLAFVQVPVLMSILRHATDESPMRELLQDAATLEQRPHMLSLDVAEGYPYADVADVGMSVVAVGDGDSRTTVAVAEQMASLVWASRAAMPGVAATIEQALAMVAANGERPLVLLDSGDNVGAGSPGDSVAILTVADRMGISVTQTICDDRAVARCAEVGAAASLELDVGGRLDPSASRPLTVRGHVRRVGDGRFEDMRATHGGFRRFDGGPTAVFETERGHVLVLTSRAVMGSSIEQFYSFGVDPAHTAAVVAKGVVSPRPAFEAIAAAFVVVETPGVTTADLASLPYQARRRPLYPLEHADFSLGSAAS